MALVRVEVTNNTKDVTGKNNVVVLTLDEDGDMLAHLHKLAKREDLQSVKVLPAARKTAASK
jgi:predicted DNA-binding protein with PD1-like motif